MAGSLTEIMNIRGPQGFNAAITEAANRESITQAEFARRAILERIARTGVTPPAVKPLPKREG
ncbi:hypothetical protein V5F29_08155 [Xanthobacter aminoxidans]|uniref:hypothetical protein n=1 Tax=Xanthobacter aminoxidans TaxID=186280 RepID=UPI003728B786